MRSVLLLRGINVGGKNRMPMKELVAVLASLGFTNIQHYIQTGNLVLTHDAPLDLTEVGQAIEAEFGFLPSLMVVSQQAFDQAIAQNPFASENPDGKVLHFFFCEETPQPDLEKIHALATETEAFQIVDKVVYLYTPEGFGKSKLATKLERLIGVPATARNLNTVQKIQALL